MADSVKPAVFPRGFGREAVRLLFLVPPLMLVFAGALMVLMAPFSWGVADHVDLPSWLMPLCAVIFGTPPVIGGVAALRRIRRVTARRFAILWLHLPLAVVPVCTTFALLALAGVITDPASFDHMRQLDGTVIVTAEGVLAGAVMVSIFAQAFLLGATYIYSQAFVEDYGRDRSRPVEIDRVGGLLRRP